MSLDPVLHQEARLRIVALLARNRLASFGFMRDALDLTDGNLGAHLQRLEQRGYVVSRRVLAGVSFRVRYSLTQQGSNAFRLYAEEVARILEGARG